jgi:predicted transcriptional regulator
MKKMKEVILTDAIDALCEGQDVYILTRLTAGTVLGEIVEADKFIILEDIEPQEAQNEATETPKKTKTAKKKQAPAEKTADPESGKPIDTGKILALSKAGWTTAAIAAEMGISQPTVLKYIRQDGGERE